MSRGVQHASPLVRYATLCALRRMLDALSAALASAAQAADAASTPARTGSASIRVPEALGGSGAQNEVVDGGVEGGGGWNAGAWRGFLGRLRSAARARLPDLQALLALHASLDGQIRQPLPPDALTDTQVSPAVLLVHPCAVATSDSCPKNKALSVQLCVCVGVGFGVCDCVQSFASLCCIISSTGPPYQAAHLCGMHKGLEPVQAEGLSAAELAMVQLLAVLTRWHACMPEAFAEARYDVQRLLPQACFCILL